MDIRSIEIVDIQEHQYHAETGHGPDMWLTRSMLFDYIVSPHGYYLRHVERHPEAKRDGQSKSMQLGTYFDVLVTEGLTEANRRFVSPPYEYEGDIDHWFTPSGKISTKASVVKEIEKAIEHGAVYRSVPQTVKAWAEGLPVGVEARDDFVWDKARYMESMLFENPLASRILKTSTGMQTTIRAVLENGLRFQCRIDVYSEQLGIVADLKTTNKTKDRFLKSAVQYGYHIQDYLYGELAKKAGLEVRHPFLFLCQMNCYPWESYVLQLPEEVHDWAELQTNRAIDGIASGTYGEYQSKAYIPYTEYWLLNLIDQE